MLRLVLNLDLSSEVQGRLQDAVEMENRDEVARIVADVFKGSGDIEVTTSIKRKGKLRPGVSKPSLWTLGPNDMSRN